MKSYSFVHLADQSVLCEYDAIESRENADTATALALLGEIDARKLYVPAGYPSMYAYCLQARHMSEDRAYKRIRVARAARQCPAIYPAIAEGRLHLSALFLLAPHLTPDTVDALLPAATHSTKAQVELLHAERFPKPDLPAILQPIGLPAADERPIGQVELCALQAPVSSEVPPAPGRVVPSNSGNAPSAMEPLAAPPVTRPRIAPLSPGRFALQLTLNQSTHDKLRHAQALLSHALPTGDVEHVLDRALDSLIAQLEHRKFKKSARPRPQRAGTGTRHIPAEVQRTVWKRDGGQCTFGTEFMRGKRRAVRGTPMPRAGSPA